MSYLYLKDGLKFPLSSLWLDTSNEGPQATENIRQGAAHPAPYRTGHIFTNSDPRAFPYSSNVDGADMCVWGGLWRITLNTWVIAGENFTF